MKPSERIEEIRRIVSHPEMEPNTDVLQAIIQYLDEEHERRYPSKARGCGHNKPGIMKYLHARGTL